MESNVRPQLRKIAEDLAAGRAVPPVTTREFLSWFFAQRRGYWVVQSIRRELDRAALQTVPDFESTYIDDPIEFERRSETNESVRVAVDASTEPITLESAVQTPAPITLLISKDPTYRIRRLAAANQGVVSVKPDATLAECMAKMLLGDFSQLPVMINDRDVKGAVSWKTIGSQFALSQLPEFAREAMVPYHELRASASIFEAIPLVVAHDYVLVRGDANRIIGIITATDLSEQFQQLSEPFLLLGEIENLLRGIIGDHFSVSEFAGARDPGDEIRKVESPADLNFGEYVRLLQKPENWNRLSLAIDRTVFCNDLDAIREIRNNVMHFDPEGIIDNDLSKLRKFTNFLKQLEGALTSKSASKGNPD